MLKRKLWSSALLLLLAPLASRATVIIDGSTWGLYNQGLGDMAAVDGPNGFFLLPIPTEGDPTLLPVMPLPSIPFYAPLGTHWLAGNYTGGTWSSAPVAIPSQWNVNDETAIVYNFILNATSNLHIDLGVDNGILVWLNGNYIFGAQNSGGSSLSEYDIDLAGLGAGSYALQILREDHGGATGYDILADAVRVPEPASLSLLGVGLLSLGMFRRSRKSA